MCKEIAILRKDGSAILVDKKGEIEAELGGEVPGLEGEPSNSCLCPLDEIATAKKFGYTITSGWDTPYSCDLLMTPNVVLDAIFLKNGTQTSLKTLQIFMQQNGDWPRRMMPITRDEPHPPTRDCPCKDCLPSFEDDGYLTCK